VGVGLASVVDVEVVPAAQGSLRAMIRVGRDLVGVFSGDECVFCYALLSARHDKSRSARL